MGASKNSWNTWWMQIPTVTPTWFPALHGESWGWKGRGRGRWVNNSIYSRKKEAVFFIETLPFWFRGFFGGTNNDVVCPLNKKHNKPKNPATWNKKKTFKPENPLLKFRFPTILGEFFPPLDRGGGTSLSSPQQFLPQDPFCQHDHAASRWCCTHPLHRSSARTTGFWWLPVWLFVSY